MHPEMDTSEWQVRHRHEVATRGRGMTTTTDRQHNHDLRVILDRLDLARAELAVAVTERDQLREKLAAMRPGLTVA
jgi:hypothetical protein